MADKCADPETLLDVDTSILEYLLFVTISTLLDIARARRGHDLPPTKKRQVELLILMVSSFLVIFRSNHPDILVSSTIDFRLRLLKFTTLFTRRFHPSETSVLPASLETLRGKRRKRARIFRSHYDFLSGFDLSCFSTSLPFPEDSQHQQRERLSTAFAHDDNHPDYYGTEASLSLLDTLPMFLNLLAAQTAMHGNNVTGRWMRLAACYMTEAVLEQYLVYGAAGPEPILEAFAYGFDVKSVAETGSDELAVTNMFWGGENEREVGGWKEIREEHLAALLPPKDVPLQKHLADLEATALLLVKFEGEVVEFLGTLLHAQPPPVLVELEKAGISDPSFIPRNLRQNKLSNSFM